MAAALPPVTDCCCCRSSSSSSSSTGTSACCPLTGLGDPNELALIPDDPTLWIEYRQLADLVAGPVIQLWYWNPNLLVWQ